MPRDKYAVYRDGHLIARAKNWREAHKVIDLEKQDYPNSRIYCIPIKR